MASAPETAGGVVGCSILRGSPEILAAISAANLSTAAIISPLLVSFGLETELEKALAVLAVGAGAMTVSHINDSYFWVVSQFSHLSVKAALKSHTIATLFQGIVGIIILLLIHFFFA